jgi:hypothetical protein
MNLLSLQMRWVTQQRAEAIALKEISDVTPVRN